MTCLQIEAALSSCDHVDNIMVYADPFHNYCVALVVASHQSLEKWAQQAGIDYQDFPDLCNKPETVTEVLQSISKVSVRCLNICLLISVSESGSYLLISCSLLVCNRE